MISIFYRLTVATMLSLLATIAAQAAAPQAEADKLGNSLTPNGAQRAGNSEGSIPDWEGGLPVNIGELDDKGFLGDPFAAEKPLFIITKNNLDQYKAQLTPGQLSMFSRYGKTYQLPVYPTHRTAALPDKVYAAIKRNATRTRLVPGGSGIVDFEMATPFPIPYSGMEVLWNHLARYRGGSVRRVHVQATPMPDGTFIPIVFRQQFTFRDQLKEFDPKSPSNLLFYYKQMVTAPTRLAGDVVLIQEYLDQVKNPRMAWLYNAGQRRVRRPPQVAYDGPYPGSDGQQVADNLDMFNGAPDRYEWTLIGKREAYIPYNAYRLESSELSYQDIVRPGHINPAYTRYERHRVWVVEGKLKPGERHVYAKRVFYIDEDSWQVALADLYDIRGTLWRTAEGHQQQLYNVQVPWLGVEALYDLINGRYIVSGMRNEERGAMEFGFTSASSEYTPSTLHQSGVR